MFKLESKRSQNVNESEISRLFRSAPHGCINLTLGQPNWPISEELKQALSEASSVQGYSPTDGYLPLKQRIIKEFLFTRSPSSITVTAGASAALTLSLVASVDIGGEVLIPDPYFVSYLPLVQMLGAKPVLIDTYLDFRISPEKIQEKITSKTQAIFLNSPSNPTGKVQSKEDIKAICELAQEKNITVISDEVYSGLTYGKVHYSPQKDFDNVITINCFSKMPGVPGWRVGWLSSNDDSLIRSAVKFNAFMTAGAPLPMQIALSKVPWDCPDAREALWKNKELIEKKLKGFEIGSLDGAFYAFAKSPKGTASEFNAELMKRGVAVTPGIGFSSKDSHFRISYATEKEKLEKALETIASLA